MLVLALSFLSLIAYHSCLSSAFHRKVFNHLIFSKYGNINLGEEFSALLHKVSVSTESRRYTVKRLLIGIIEERATKYDSYFGKIVSCEDASFKMNEVNNH